VGFYVNTDEVNLHVIPEKLDLFFERAAYMMQPEVMAKYANGGTFSAGQKCEFWYGWTDSKVLLECIETKDLVKWFQEWGFEDVLYDEESYFIDLYYNTKTSNEQFMLECVAPAFSPGDFIIWQGEDNTYWKNVFDGEKMKTFDGEVVFHETR
jgi:hypothetical protein